ncbi:MAG: hypothetical protein P1S60_15805, partial [Anaerolineae bacterium]|nr:hypothetical protein [Anaerolineae bacterium]
MTELMERFREKRYILLGMVLGLTILTLLLVLFVDDFVRDVILVPFAYYLWLGGIIINALPQSCFIPVLIAISLVIILPSLRKVRKVIWRPETRKENVPGEVSMWTHRLQLLTEGSYSQNRFAYHLGYLVVKILAYEQRLSIRETMTRLENNAFDIPDPVRQYVLTGMNNQYTYTKRPIMKKVLLWFRQIVNFNNQKKTDRMLSDMTTVIDYIEHKFDLSGSD